MTNIQEVCMLVVRRPQWKLPWYILAHSLTFFSFLEHNMWGFITPNWIKGWLFFLIRPWYNFPRQATHGLNRPDNNGPSSLEKTEISFYKFILVHFIRWLQWKLQFLSCNLKKRFIFMLAPMYIHSDVQIIILLYYETANSSTSTYKQAWKTVTRTLNNSSVISFASEDCCAGTNFMSNESSQTETESLFYSEYTMPSSARSNYLSKQNQCALTYANKPYPGGSLICHLSIMYCITDPCYINKNEWCINNATTDLTLSE